MNSTEAWLSLWMLNKGFICREDCEWQPPFYLILNFHSRSHEPHNSDVRDKCDRWPNTDYILTRLMWLTKQVDVDNSLVTLTNLMYQNTLGQSDNMLATFFNLIFHILNKSHCLFEIQATCTVFYFSSDQSLSRVQLFAPLQTAACQASKSITNCPRLLRLMSFESVMPSKHFILCCSLFLPSIFPSIRFFSSELTLHQVAKVLELQL